MKADAENDAKVRAEESHKLAQAAEKVAEEKRAMQKEAQEKYDKLAAMKSDMDKKSNEEI
jgi:hypothetical protein